MLDIVQILRRNRFLVFARRTCDARSFKAHPFAFRASLIAPPKVFSFAAIATPLVTLIRGTAYHGWNSRQEIALRNPRYLRLADRRLDPKGLLSPYWYAGTGVTRRPLGRGRKEAVKTAVVPLDAGLKEDYESASKIHVPNCPGGPNPGILSELIGMGWRKAN